MDSMTAIGPGATVEKPGDYAIVCRADGEQLVISEDGEGRWAGEISLREAASGAADTLVRVLWREGEKPQEVVAVALVRLFDRLGDDAVLQALGPVDAALFKMLAQRNDARAIFVLETLEAVPLCERREMLGRLILAGLDVSRRISRE